ncbi:hypothetical protein FRC17_002755 [Serendipita sp. 399]|nr:hypothetical protein FRC17_002755 [Serendipita sp. 399]
MDLRLSNELENECRKLFSDLSDLDPQDPRCAALQERYNRIIDDHWNSPFSDPLDVLPLEICDQIFTEATLALGDHFQVDKALLLSTVSSRWLRHIISLSSLWTCIYISHDTQDASARLATCLTLSGERKISIFILTSTWESYIGMLIPHTNRIERMRLDTINDVSRVTESLGYLPALTSISLPYSFHQLPDFDERTLRLMDNAPSLTSLGFFDLTRVILQHPRATKLTVIGTQVPLYELVHILSRTMKPLQLSISSLRLEAGFEDEKAVNIEKNPMALIRVDSLTLSRFPPSYGKLFPQCIASVRFLTVGISTGNELEILFFALRSTQIEELSLELLKEAGPIPPRSKYAILGSLRRLEISSFQPKLSLGSLIPVVSIIAPFLAYLDTANYALDKGIYYLGLFQHLRELVVFFDPTMPELKGPIYFKSLEKLKLSIASPFDLSFMRTRKLGHIHARVYTYANKKIFSASYLIPTSSFSTLTVVHILAYLPTHLRLASLPLLQALHVNWDAARVWGCELLEQLILTPRICPDLHVIRIDARPIEWDIALLMLLRRNFLHDKSVSRIQEIQFQPQLPIPLVWPISNLLRCKLVPGLELRDFSLEKMIELLFQTLSE